MTASPLSKDRIVAVATELVRQEGADALGLRKVARALEVTAPALYGYVDSLDGLFRALAEAQFSELTRRFDEVDVGDPVTRVRALSRVYIQYALDEPKLFGLLFRLPPDLSGGTEHELPAATKVFMVASAPLGEGLESGVFPGIEPLSAALAVWSAVHGCATTLTMGFDFDEATNERLIDDVLDMVIAGLTS